MQRYHNGKLVPTLLTVTDKRAHAQLRRPIANIFSMSTVAHFEPLIDSTIRQLIENLEQKFAAEPAQQICIIDKWLQYCKGLEYNTLWNLVTDKCSKSLSMSLASFLLVDLLAS